MPIPFKGFIFIFVCLLLTLSVANAGKLSKQAIARGPTKMVLHDQLKTPDAAPLPLVFGTGSFHTQRCNAFGDLIYLAR